MFQSFLHTIIRHTNTYLKHTYTCKLNIITLQAHKYYCLAITLYFFSVSLFIVILILFCMICHILPHSLPACKVYGTIHGSILLFLCKETEVLCILCCLYLEPREVFLILMFTNLGVELEFIDCLLKYIFTLNFNTPFFKFLFLMMVQT